MQKLISIRQRERQKKIHIENDTRETKTRNKSYRISILSAYAKPRRTRTWNQGERKLFEKITINNNDDDDDDVDDDDKSDNDICIDNSHYC